MSEKYTYADVIIDPEDPRVEIGAEYYTGDYPRTALNRANAGERFGVLKCVDKKQEETPFIVAESFIVADGAGSVPWACLIRKKEQKKYVPFDFDDPEVRKALMGKTIKADNRPFSRQYVEFTISCFELVDEGAEGVGGYWMVNGIKEDELFHDWTFLDGSICGKLTEEDQ